MSFVTFVVQLQWLCIEVYMCESKICLAIDKCGAQPSFSGPMQCTSTCTNPIHGEMEDYYGNECLVLLKDKYGIGMCYV